MACVITCQQLKPRQQCQSAKAYCIVQELGHGEELPQLIVFHQGSLTHDLPTKVLQFNLHHCLSAWEPSEEPVSNQVSAFFWA